MLCSEVMRRDVERCLDTSLVSEAASAMRDRNVGFLPVTTADGTAVGTLTDRDLTVRVLADGRPGDRTTVADVMTSAVVECSPDDELAIAEDLMSRFQKSRIVCTDQQRRVVGIISLSNIAHTESGGHAAAVASSIAARQAFVPGDRVTGGEGLGQELSCRDVMKSSVVCCEGDTPASEIAALMRDRDIGFVPVIDRDGAVIGTVTDRDLVLRVMAERRDPVATLASEICTPELVACAPEDRLEVAEELMLREKKSRILCVDALRRPLGVISLSDVARIQNAARVSELLRGLSSRVTMRL